MIHQFLVNRMGIKNAGEVYLASVSKSVVDSIKRRFCVTKNKKYLVLAIL